MLSEATMIDVDSYWAIATLVFLISIGLAICSFGFLILCLASTLRKRQLTIRELMIHVAGAGVTVAILSCFRFKALRYGQSLFWYPEPVWLSLGFSYLVLAPIMVVIYRNSRR
jgi:hypothetical protein